ncbi:putative heat shock protein Hsp20 [Actinoplanes missouriensis 431]|uniref:Putative heat shock protein Hsp20 n=1 Tax=Actinoplanes missouriensis (strain ATCC 14538 / DSM 43046 / CBS 188.64 / JCM 3121 / NBRC 102363 / NCIMB 12654 / NRRL B-3342 / UNCC 431) TaxID=512565 RepID=I0H5N7_ACTM4|nr:Hsp20/alpha crystallin family protein [Actinoplanes missouriensis]BAL88324.1 putative heat shock protein Hsp20 [Actinoplanes missouriensis 431]
MLLRTDPFRELDRMFEQFTGTSARPAVMHVDAERDGDTFYVYFDLPGVDPDSIDVTVERNVLQVQAQRQRRSRDGVEAVISERPMGVFNRQLFLADTLDTEKLEAVYDNGVLTLRIPISDRAKPRRIAIGGGTSGRKQIKG